MAYWTQEQVDNINKALWQSMDDRHKQWEKEREMEQFRKDILKECQSMIDKAISQRLDLLIQNNAIPEIQKLDKMMKNIGNL